MLGAYLASRFYGDDVERLGRWMLDHWGLGGILLLVVFIDTFTPGFPFETVLYFPMAAGEPWWWLAGLGGTASMLAGLCGYGLGRWLGQGLGVVERFQERPWFAPMRRHGIFVTVLSRRNGFADPSDLHLPRSDVGGILKAPSQGGCFALAGARGGVAMGLLEVGRTHDCGALHLEHTGEEVILMGWVDAWRDLGGRRFIDLRDRGGVTQVVFGQELDAELDAKARRLRHEWVIAVRGRVDDRVPPDFLMLAFV